LSRTTKSKGEYVR